MNAQLKITLPPMEFEAFNALDILLEQEIAELSHQLRVMDGRAELARANVRRYLTRLQTARTLIAAGRPPGYRELIQSQFARDSVCDA
jgi:hypothetical protein